MTHFVLVKSGSFVCYVCRRRSSVTSSSCTCSRNDTFTRERNICMLKAMTRTCLRRHRSDIVLSRPVC